MELVIQNETIEAVLATAKKYLESGNVEQAENYFNQALLFDENNFTAIFELAKLYYTGNNFELAEYFLLKAIKIKPNTEGLYSVLGIVQKTLGRYGDAERSYLKALQINPDFYEAYYNLGILLYIKNQKDEAIFFFKKAIELNKNLYLAHYNLGNIYREYENYGEAADEYSQSIQIKNDFADGYYNLGVVKEHLFDYESALLQYTFALQHNPNHGNARWNKALILLLLQNYEKGFKEYEWRKKKEDYPKRVFIKPELTNQEIKGRRLYIYDDQGLGDTIQFSRYLVWLKNLGAEIIFECDKKLSELFSNFKAIDYLVERSSQQQFPIDYDYHISLLSLPYYFSTTYESVPAENGYLKPAKILVEKWKKKIGFGDHKIKVGLVWAGNPHHTRDKARSIDFREFINLLGVENVNYFSLQLVNGEVMRPDELERFGIDVLEITTFADTAAIIENLDLVISVDTSVAHLAGAMGKPVWNLIYYYPDWRWGLEGSTTPWYPSMKLFRQAQPFQWMSVLEKVKSELELFAQRKLNDAAGKEKSWTFRERKTLYTGLAKGNNFGWGVCSNYLREELSKKITIINLDENDNLFSSTKVDDIVLHALVDIDMHSLFDIRGKYNIAYTFFENELTPLSLQNLKNYDVVFVGSTWNKTKLEQAGVENVELLIQGIDQKIFYPTNASPVTSNYFKIFSGGKFELRKGQDMVLKAIKILQQKHRDIILVNAWYNYLPATMTLMSKSKHLNFENVGEKWQESLHQAFITNSLDRVGDLWVEHMRNIYKSNSIDAGRILTFPLVANKNSRELYLNTDLGLFPNRAEGGTNLVLMEYMACGKPVIASFSTGHKDMLTEENSIPLKKMREYKLYNDNGILTADWEEADMDEIISAIEYAYFNRDTIKNIGAQAAQDLKQYTWSATAEKLLTVLDRF